MSKIGAFLRQHYPALAHPSYVRLLWATAFSSLGSQFTVLALSVAVYSATGSVASLAGIWAVRVASRLLLQPFTGALADRWDRRRTLVGGYLLSALLAASLVLVLHEPLWVYPLVFLIQTVEGLVSPAMAAAVPSLVPKEALVSANALRVVLTKVTASLGPALAGLLYGLVGPLWLFLFDALTFAGVAYAVRGLPATLGAAQSRRGTSLWAEAAEGVGFAVNSRTVLIILLLSLLTSLFWRVVEIVMVPISLEVAQIGAAGMGLLYTSLTLGGVLGVAFLGALKKGIPGLAWVVLLNTLLAVPMLLGATFPTFPMLLAVFFLSGILFDISGVATQSLLQAVVPKQFLGRVFSLVNVSLALGVLPVLALVDPLVRWLGSAGTLQIVSLLVGGMGVLLFIAAKVRVSSVEKKEEPSG
ncbi:MAG: MFS transporter [Meiothermus sp.]|uniref:MFS transporter n=1 Tax=Meiothermus sp. TaxID=1955249 RepID=UPI0021DE207B|nr:MFS transporter [Meiothermus sp.]GIW28872.1 MAG: MFS transporter [Meiothermus sp.]